MLHAVEPIDMEDFFEASDLETAALSELFAYARKTRFAAPFETYYRQAHALMKDGLPEWSDRRDGFVLGLRVFLAVARSLVDIVDDQQAVFDKARREAAREAKAAGVRRRIAGRRARRAERRSRAPEAARNIIATQARNLKARQKHKPPATPAKAAPVKAATPATKAKPRNGHGDIVGRSRGKPGGKKKPAGGKR